MSHFYARIPTSSRRTAPTACGTKYSGLKVEALAMSGGIGVYLWHDPKVGDMFEVTRCINGHTGQGVSQTLMTGPVDPGDGKPEARADNVLVDQSDKVLSKEQR